MTRQMPNIGKISHMARRVKNEGQMDNVMTKSHLTFG